MRVSNVHGDRGCAAADKQIYIDHQLALTVSSIDHYWVAHIEAGAHLVYDCPPTLASMVSQRQHSSAQHLHRRECGALN